MWFLDSSYAEEKNDSSISPCKWCVEIPWQLIFFGVKGAKNQCHWANNSLTWNMLLMWKLIRPTKWCRHTLVYSIQCHIHNLTFHILHRFVLVSCVAFSLLFSSTEYTHTHSRYTIQLLTSFLRRSNEVQIILKTPEVMQNIYFIEKSIPVALIHAVGWARDQVYICIQQMMFMSTSFVIHEPGSTEHWCI